MSTTTRSMIFTGGRVRELELAERMVALLHDSCLEDFGLAERRAIVCFHVLRQFDEGAGFDISRSVLEWVHGACKSWRKKKMQLDSRQQIREIRRYRRALARRGMHLDLEEAARRWIPRYAGEWRDRWEQQVDSTPMIFPYFFFNLFVLARRTLRAAI